MKLLTPARIEGRWKLVFKMSIKISKILVNWYLKSSRASELKDISLPLLVSLNFRNQLLIYKLALKMPISWSRCFKWIPKRGETLPKKYCMISLKNPLLRGLKTIIAKRQTIWIFGKLTILITFPQKNKPPKINVNQGSKIAKWKENMKMIKLKVSTTICNRSKQKMIAKNRKKTQIKARKSQIRKVYHRKAL